MKRFLIYLVISMAIPFTAFAEIERHNARLPMQVYIGRDSPYVLTISSEGSKINTSLITGAEFIFSPVAGTREAITKSECSGCFTFIGLLPGQIQIDLGGVNWTPGRDRTAKLVLYSSAWPTGRVVGTIDTEALDTATDAALLEPLETSIGLSDLNNVTIDIETLDVGQALVWNGTAWVNIALAGTGDMTKAEYDTDAGTSGIVDQAAVITGQGEMATVDDAPSDGTGYVRKDGSWAAETGGAGDVVGPASAVDENIAVFDSTTGKLIKDGGVAISGLATSGHGHPGVYEPADATILKDADIGVNVQAYDADLDTYAGITPSADGQTLLVSADANPFTDADESNLDNQSGTNSGDAAVNSTYDTGSDGDVDVIDATLWATKSDSGHDHSGVYEPAGITGSDISDQNAGTDVTADLEEETHASEHALGAADTVFPADPNADRYLMWDDDPGVLVWSEVSGGGYTNLTSFVSQTAWRLFYSNGDGDVTELAFGTDGQVLTSTGASTAPAFEDAPGGSVTYATASEINTGTETAKAINPDALADSKYGLDRTVQNVSATTSSTTVDLSSGHIVLVAISANTSIAFSNVPSGYCRVIMRFTQDGTGSRTWTNQSSFKWPMDVELPLSTTAGAKDDFQFYTFDGGTTWNVAMIGAEVQ